MTLCPGPLGDCLQMGLPVLEELQGGRGSGRLQTGRHLSFPRKEKVDEAVTRMRWSDSDFKPCSRRKSLCPFRVKRGIAGDYREFPESQFSQSAPAVCQASVCRFSAE